MVNRMNVFCFSIALIICIFHFEFVSSITNNDNDETTIIKTPTIQQETHSNNNNNNQIKHQKHALLFSIPLAGHLNPLLGIGEELVSRGWKVTVATLNEAKSHVEHQTSLLAFLDLGNCSSYASAPKKTAKEFAFSSSSTSDFGEGSLHMFMYTIQLQPCLYSQFLSLSKTIQKPNIIITDFSTTVGLDISRHLQIPVILNNADLLSMISSHTLPSADFVPSLFTEHTLVEMARKHTQYALMNRCIYILARNFFYFYIKYYLQPFSNEIRALDATLPPLEYYTQTEGHITLVNGAFPLEYPRYLPPNIIMTGVMMSIQQRQRSELNEEERIWIENDNRVVMWVSMGTLAPLSEMQMTVLFSAFQRVTEKVKIFWKVSTSQRLFLTENFTVKKEDIFLTSWISSQFGVLGHSRTKIFLSHCGINSVYESLYYQVELLCLPQFFDQRDMAIRVQDSHVGLMLDKANMTVEDTTSKILSLLTDTSYTHDVARISSAIKLTGGVVTAANIVEYVELYGSKEFGTNDVNYNFLARYNIDAYFLISICVFIIVLILYMMMKCMFRITKFVCCCARAKKIAAKVHAKDE